MRSTDRRGGPSLRPKPPNPFSAGGAAPCPPLPLSLCGSPVSGREHQGSPPQGGRSRACRATARSAGAAPCRGRPRGPLLEAHHAGQSGNPRGVITGVTLYKPGTENPYKPPQSARGLSPADLRVTGELGGKAVGAALRGGAGSSCSCAGRGQSEATLPVCGPRGRRRGSAPSGGARRLPPSGLNSRTRQKQCRP